MKLSILKSRPARILLSHLPIIISLLILIYLTLLDSPLLEQYRDEQDFALMVILWIPLAILMGLIQIFIWIRWLVKRSGPLPAGMLKVGFAVVVAAFIFIAILRYLS